MVATEPGRLLIVDDERDFAEFIRTVASELGFEVLILQHSPDFEHVVETWHPTIVALDILMPYRDGFEVLAALAKRAYRGHLILMSGADKLYLELAVSTARAQGLRLAAAWSKPCRKDEIAGVLSALATTP